MPLCEEYQEMSHADKIVFIGKLVHSVQTDSKLFALSKKIIELADIRGVLDGVTINPPKDGEGN